MPQPTSQKNRSDNALINAATPLLQLVMRLNARVVTPTPEMRQQVDGMLKQFDERAQRYGYTDRQLQNVRFALVAFVDEAVLSGGFAAREEWELFPLQLQYFNEALAGTKFYDRLDGLLKQMDTEADIVEIYYICLLLGFKGKYVAFLEDQLPGVIQQVEDALRRVGRLRSPMLAPHWQKNDQPPPPTAQPALPAWIKWGALVALGFTAFVYLLLKLVLTNSANALKEGLLK